MPASMIAALSVIVFGAALLVSGLRQIRQEHQEHLPAVQPARQFDHSDTTPDYGRCPECYLLWLQRTPAAQIPRDASGAYLQPEGPARLCPEHAASTLGYAMRREEATR